jgi:hypothetical protein
MSTKTTFKRIALVAVAALGLGTLSSYAPATAAVNGDTNTVAFASTSVELGQDAVLVLFQQFVATGAAGADTQTVTFTVTQNAFTTTAANTAAPQVFLGSDTGTVSTGTTAQVARGYATGAVLDGFPAADITAGAVNVNNTQSVVAGTNSTAAITVKNVNSVSGASALTSVRGFQRVQWKPTLVGSYSLTVKTYPADATSGTASNTYVWNFTVAAAGTAAAAAATAANAALVVSPSYSTTTLGYGFNNSASAEGGEWYNRTVAGTADDVYVSNSVSAGTANFFGTGLEGAGSLVTLNATTSSGTTLVPVLGATLWAEINSGPGILQIRDNSAANNNSGAVISQGRNIAGTLPATDNIGKVLIFSDGKAGVANYSIYAATKATGAKTLLATYSVTFFDTPKTITPTALVNAINGDIGAGSTVAASLAVYDQNGYFVPGPWLTANGYVAKVTSADTTIIKSIATGAPFAKRPTKDLTNVVALQPMGGKFGAVSLTATFTNDTGAFTTPTGFSNAGKTLVTNTATSAAWSTVVSSSVAASMTVTADKAAYETGSIVTLSFKGLDVNGLILPDAYSYGITSTSDIAVAGINTSNIVGLASTNLGTSVKFGGLGSAGVGNTTIDAAGTAWPYASATPGVVNVKFYAPLVQGAFNITVKRGATNYATAIAATSTVLALKAENAAAIAAEAVAQAAQDAAAEAIDAANNAYDAATAAGEAADAATAAAEQAGEDAVAAAEAAGAAAVAAAEAATEAAAEATDAANAATDAANASAEAADAATAAAQDAADAVAALSTQVSEMITALKKQITALTNLVIKIQKKVKA